MKGIVKALLRRTPYRIVRAGALNRFNAVDELLPVLRDRGFRPTRVIDGGANVGAFARGAKSVFPDSEIEMIEPQPACHEALRRLELETGYTFHPVALVGPVHMKPSIDLNVSPGEATTGAHVSATPNETAVSVPAANSRRNARWPPGGPRANFYEARSTRVRNGGIGRRREDSDANRSHSHRSLIFCAGL